MGIKVNLEPNSIISNEELRNTFLCAPQGGMRMSKRMQCLVLISDKTALYDDKVINGIYHYTGMGQDGDQKLSGQNLTLAQSRTNNVDIHFFEVLKKREYTYKGQVELAADPYQEIQPDKNGKKRKVWVFPLYIKGGVSEFYSPKIRPSINIQNELVTEQKVLHEIKGKFDNDNFLDETEKERIIKTRVGQSIFKKKLLKRLQKCALCGVDDERFLIASHIKPWSESNDFERLDVDNGLLLCPNHDSLFDKHLIGFNEDGLIVISSTIDKNQKIFMNINENMKIEPNKKQKEYLKLHIEKLLR